MVTGYHLWMLQRLQKVVEECASTGPGEASVRELLERVPEGLRLLSLGQKLAECPVRKEGGLAFLAREGAPKRNRK